MDYHYMDDTDMDNVTMHSFMEDLENDPLNPFEYEMDAYHKLHRFVTVYLASVIHLVILISILASTGLFCFAIYKFKRLQTKTNYILLNFFISVTCFSICIMAAFVLETYRVRPGDIGFLFMGFLQASVLMALLLSIDWFVSANCNNTFISKYQKKYKWAIGGIYSFAALQIFLFVFDHQFNAATITLLITVLVYFISVIIMVIFNILKLIKTFSQEALKTSYALTLSSVFFLMWLPIATCLVGSAAMPHNLTYESIVILNCVLYLMDFVAFSAPIVMVILLIRLDQNFKMSCDYVFKRSVRSYAMSSTSLDDDTLDIEAC